MNVETAEIESTVRTAENGTHSVQLPETLTYGFWPWAKALSGLSAEQAVDLKRALDAMYRIGHQSGYQRAIYTLQQGEAKQP